MKNRFLAGLAAVSLLVLGSFSAQAQSLQGVSDNLDASCEADGLGGAVDEEACLAAVEDALNDALLGDTQARVAIGFLLGELAERLPALAQAIVMAIEAAAVPGVDVGFFNAVGDDYEGPLPSVISPA